MADDLLNSAMESIEKMVGPIRASNAANMDTANGIRKTTERKIRTGQVPAQKRMREEGESSKAPKPAKVPKVTMADSKYQQQKHSQAQQNTKGYMVKLNTMARFRASRTLWPWLMEHGDRSILMASESSEKDLDKKLAHIDSVCSSNGSADKLKKAIWAACNAVERFSGNGEAFNMNITGYADDVYTHLDEVEMELEVMRCKYGDWFTCPWYVTLGMFFAGRAVAVHQRNEELLIPRGSATVSSELKY